MKNLNKIMLVALAAGFGLASCGEDYEDYTVGAPQAADNEGVYFNVASQILEYAPEDATEFTVTVSRLNTENPLTVSFDVENDQDVFEVPTAVSFAAGEAETTFTVNFPKANLGDVYTLALTVPTEYQSVYSSFDGALSTKISVSRIKWEKIDHMCYWEDGIACTWYGVITGPFAVEVEKAVTPTSTKYRFVGPYSHFNANTDEAELGYLGYPYTGVEYDEEDHMFVITVTGGNAVLDPVQMGITFGPDGMMNTGTILGNLSNDETKYTYGIATADGSKVYFPANSLYVNEPGYGTGICSKVSTLYLEPDELMVPDEYQPVGYGFYDYAALFQWPANYGEEYGLIELLQSTEDASKYRLAAWDLMNGGDLDFTMGEDQIIDMEEQYTGYKDEELGKFYVKSFVETKSYFDYNIMEQVTDTVAISTYDAEKDIFNFNLMYTFDEGVLNVGLETFEMIEWYATDEEGDGEGEAAAPRKARKASGKFAKKPTRRPSQFAVTPWSKNL